MSETELAIVHPSAASTSDLAGRLERSGYSVRTFSDAPQAAGSQAALVLLAAEMVPESWRPTVPVILLAPEDYQLPEQASFRPHAIVTEPLRGRELENALDLILNGQGFNPAQALVDSVRHYALFTVDSKGTITSWNPGAASLYGYQSSEVIGSNHSILYVEEDKASNIPDRELELAKHEGAADDTRWLARKGGERFWAEGMTTAVKNGLGEVMGFAKVTRDATERRQLEQKLERSNDELQRFAYTVSHDLQEPLRTVRSYAELLSRRYSGQLDQDATEFLHFMMDGAGRMTQLLKDLLLYSQAGRPDRTAPEPTQSSAMLQWALMNVDRLVKDSGATVTFDPLPMVHADQTQLSQVFQNLLGNSIKYRSEEPPQIHVSARRLDQMYEFSISDNGIGVDPSHHERIFGVFKRLHGKDVPGTGIGLAICRKIIESHGGRIWIESEAGRGAIFKFTLPAVD